MRAVQTAGQRTSKTRTCTRASPIIGHVAPGTPRLALTFRIAGGLIHAYEVIADPEKLDAMSIEIDS